MLLEDLSAYLVADLGLVAGTDLFIGISPEAPDRWVSLHETTSNPPTFTMGGSGVPIIESPMLMAYARDTSYLGARTLIQDVWLSLQKIANETLSGTFYQRVQAVSSPVFLSRDENRRVLMSANFSVMKNV